MHINILEEIMLNGKNQWVSVRAEEEGLPILIYLHGGPGYAVLPLFLKYNKELEKHFTVAVLEQRGAGKSYYAFSESKSESKNINITAFVNDALELINVLLARFNQKKVYLIGHSWGSVLGLRLAIEHPELIAYYIGCGQIVNMLKSSKAAYDFALERNFSAGNMIKTKKIESIDPTYSGKNWQKDLAFITNEVIKNGGSLYGKSNYNKFSSDFINTDYYTIKDLLNHKKGYEQSVRLLWQELMLVNFENITKFNVPILFAEGRYDYHVSSALAQEYFKTITTEKKFCFFEESCHLPQWSEPEKFNQLIISLLSL